MVCHDPEVDGVLVCQATTDQLVHLPVLDDILQRYSQRAFLDIELKVSGSGIQGAWFVARAQNR